MEKSYSYPNPQNYSSNPGKTPFDIADGSFRKSRGRLHGQVVFGRFEAKTGSEPIWQPQASLYLSLPDQLPPRVVCERGNPKVLVICGYH